MHKLLLIITKELRDFFSTPAALLFLGMFVTASLVSFFWVEAFFSRNIADLKPLFKWMPLLLIFLVAALTMRSWSEERRSGAIELVLTSPTQPLMQILGKFFSIIFLVGIALLLTLPLPIMVDILGDLDWGPVLGGYVAALFLASAYIAIGLWVSSKTDNQIVSLIVTVSISLLFYIIGSQTFTSLFSYNIAEVLNSISTSGRFESITRGVLDFRDILFYLSVSIVFLVFNRLSLEKIRWAGNPNTSSHIKWYRMVAGLIVSLVFINIVVSFVSNARIDLTEGNVYTLSDTTKKYLKDLDQPLLIRGYFSATTHPLLAPLIPTIRDMLNEYALAGGDSIRVEFIDPQENIKFEEDASTKYGIRPVAFQTTSKYQASVLNTYFNILVKYQDQYDVLGYKDLVELKTSAGGNEVELKNPEYDISRTIRTVIAKSRRQVPALEQLERPLAVSAYMSSMNNLPEPQQTQKKLLEDVIDILFKESGGNIDALFIDPDEDELTAEYLSNELNVRPQSVNFSDSKPFWFYASLSDGKASVPINLPENATQESVRAAILAAVKRLLPDTIKKVAFLTPSATPGPAGISASIFVPKNYKLLRDHLRESVNVVDLKLTNMQVPSDVDFLIVFSPRYLDPTFQVAIEKFLIQGGTVLLAMAPIDASVSDITDVSEIDSGLESWLAKYGVIIHKELVLDPQSGILPLPVPRRAGAFNVRETKIVDYPYIVDVRDKGLNQDSIITSRLGQLYVPWAAPITIDMNRNVNRKITPLLSSSDQSWSSSSIDVLPDFDQFPELGFPINDHQLGPKLLAAMLEGDFSLAETMDEKTSAKGNTAVVNKEPRLIVVASNSLFTDHFYDQMTQALRTEYKRPHQFALNLIDWSLEDRGMLQVLRKHSHFTRTLKTLSSEDKKFWEYLNYTFAVLGLTIIFIINYLLKKYTLSQHKRRLQQFCK